jgi:hypothetical protein
MKTNGLDIKDFKTNKLWAIRELDAGCRLGDRERHASKELRRGGLEASGL